MSEFYVADFTVRWVCFVICFFRYFVFFFRQDFEIFFSLSIFMADSDMLQTSMIVQQGFFAYHAFMGRSKNVCFLLIFLNRILFGMVTVSMFFQSILIYKRALTNFANKFSVEIFPVRWNDMQLVTMDTAIVSVAEVAVRRDRSVVSFFWFLEFFGCKNSAVCGLNLE